MTGFPISVLYFSNSVVRSGAEEHILTLLRDLDRVLFHVHLVCSPECAEKLRADLPDDVHLVPLSFQAPYHLRPAVRFAKLLRELRVDILHSHLFGASFAASPIGWMCGVPVIIETPHIREAWRHGVIKGHYFVDRMVGQIVDYYIAVSEANAHYLIDEKGLPARKIHIIHNGCNLRKYDPNRPAPKGIKQALGFAEDDPILLVLGRLEPQKGHRVLLEAFPRVLREFPSARLVCVGEGGLRKELLELTEDLRLGRSVRFVGFQSNIADWLAMCNISVLPSFFEGLPLVAIESLAAQRPMVATAVDGTTEVVMNEKTGLTVPPGDPQKLADAILRLLRQPKFGSCLARAGRDWVLEHFNQEQQVRKTQDLYLHACEMSSRNRRPKSVGAMSEEEHAPSGATPIAQRFSVSEKR